MSIDELPVIDVADLNGAETRSAIDVACRKWGFFHAIGHGFDEQLIAALKGQMRAFFAQPLKVKSAISRSADNPWGFFDRELTRHARDWKETFDYGPPDGSAIKPQWPTALPTFEPVVRAFYAACYALAQRLLKTISINLGMPANALAHYFAPEHTCFLRMNHYPRCSTPARPQDPSTPTTGHLGVNHHTDSGALTLLLQDEQPGLEVFYDGGWRGIEPRRDSLVVNIGDILQVWSNDRYRAPLHRALASTDAERFSAPFFLNPAYSVEYAPLPSTVDKQHPARYRPIQWGEFRARRAAGDYADHGDYAEIDQYRL